MDCTRSAKSRAALGLVCLGLWLLVGCGETRDSSADPEGQVEGEGEGGIEEEGALPGEGEGEGGDGEGEGEGKSGEGEGELGEGEGEIGEGEGEGEEGEGEGGAPLTCSAPLDYPPAPYGRGVGNTIRDLCFFDTDHVHRCMSVYWKECHRAIAVNVSALWCSACQAEAPVIDAIYQEYRDQGLLMLTIIYEDEQGRAATEQDAITWRDVFDLTQPVLTDPTFIMGEYFDKAATPLNMVIDAQTMEIVYMVTGFDEAGMTAAILNLLQ